jgi:hypothetical protein
MIGRQSSGDYSGERGKVSGTGERYFFTISQQKAGKANFDEKKILAHPRKTDRLERYKHKLEKESLIQNLYSSYSRQSKRIFLNLLGYHPRLNW